MSVQIFLWYFEIGKRAIFPSSQGFSEYNSEVKVYKFNKKVESIQ